MAHPRHEQAIPFPTNNGNANEVSPPIPVAGYKNLAIQIDGTFTATVTIRGRLTASMAFADLPSGTVTAPALYPIPNDIPLQAIQLVISGYSAGQVAALFAGRLAQF